MELRQLNPYAEPRVTGPYATLNTYYGIEYEFTSYAKQDNTRVTTL